HRCPRPAPRTHRGRDHDRAPQPLAAAAPPELLARPLWELAAVGRPRCARALCLALRLGRRVDLDAAPGRLAGRADAQERLTVVERELHRAAPTLERAEARLVLLRCDGAACRPVLAAEVELGGAAAVLADDGTARAVRSARCALLAADHDTEAWDAGL